MDKTLTPYPKPRRRLLRTWLKWPRNVRAFAPRIDFQQLKPLMPEPEELAHWGEVVLLEDIVVTLHRDGTVSWLTHRMTMPFGDQNLAEWDEVLSGFDLRRMRVDVRRAVVHLPDGTQRPAEKSVHPLTAHDRLLKLHFAPLRPGVVVEYETQEDLFRVDDVGPAVWTNLLLQTLWPCRRRRLTLATAPPFEGRIELHHCNTQPEQTIERGYQVYRWDLHNVPGIEADAWTPPAYDFSPWLDFSTLRGWQSVEEHYRRDLLPTAPAPPPIAELARQLTENADTPRQKALAIYSYAAKDLRYGRHPSELETPKIRDATQMLEDMRGDCKDKSSLMMSLLAEVGISSHVAILLTRANGRLNLLPGRRFDHAILMARVDGEEIWFDPAAGPFTFGDIPLGDQGVSAMLIGEEANGRFIEIPEDDPKRQCIRRHFHGSLSADGEHEYRADSSVCGERAAFYRIMLRDRNEDHRRRLVQQSVADERPGATVDEVVIGDLGDLDTPVTYSYRVRLRRWARQIDDLLVFRIPWAEPVEFTGPVSAAERLLPLALPGVQRIEERHEIRLPSDYRPYGLPYEVERNYAGVNYELNVSYDGAMLICRRLFETRGGQVAVEQFGELREFWENCTRDDQTEVILVRGDRLQ